MLVNNSKVPSIADRDRERGEGGVLTIIPYNCRISIKGATQQWEECHSK